MKKYLIVSSVLFSGSGRAPAGWQLNYLRELWAIAFWVVYRP